MNPTNDVWVLFKQEVVDKCLRDWKCSATQVYDAANYQWVRTSFTDENGVIHHPGDADWGQYSNQSERPAAPEDDAGEPTGNVRLFSEQYAMIFSFMARLLQGNPDPAIQTQRAEYVTAAKECLFTVMNESHKGIAALPWRAGNFAQNDRSFSAEAFALAVDWMYEDLTPVELAKVRKSFLIWAEESNSHIYFAPHRSNGQHGPVNSPDLLRLNDPYDGPTRYEVRLALNNHYANHARQLVLYSLALDPKDDVPVAPGSPADGIVDDSSIAGSLTSQTVNPGQPDQWIQQSYGYLQDTLGVWLYLMDYAYKHDGAGGISMEGSQYASNGLGPAALMMAALHTAGQDDPAKWGPQVSLEGHPFWSRTIPSYLALLSPTPRIPGNSTGENYLGAIFQPPLTGDLETYLYINNQFIKVLAPMALYDASVNGPTGRIAQAVRYIQRSLAPGGESNFGTRMSSMRSNKTLRDAIYTFLIFDTSAPIAVDPRPALQAKTYFSSHTVNGKEMGKLFARTGSSPTDTYFYTHLDWVGIDHIRGDSLTFGLWKNGLWLTKPMTGYGVIQGCSDYRNSLSLQNGVPTSTPVGEDICAQHGSQWNYSSLGDPEYLARSFGQNFLYVNMDGTPLYQHRQQTQLREVTHASRRMVWLKPDVLVIHDVARSKQSGYFKRVFINTPEVPQIAGNVAHASAKEDGVSKAELFVTQLLPAGATMQTTDIASGQPSGGEDMQARLYTEAPGAPQSANFLHVVQGANAGVATPIFTQLVASSSGADFEGTVVGTAVVLFRKDPLGVGDGFAYTVPATVTQHYLTGLAKSAGFDVNLSTQNGQTTVTVTPGGTQFYTDSGGVLLLGGDEPTSVDIATTDATGAEQGGDPVSFVFHRSGDVTSALTVNLQYTGSATVADFVNPPASVTFPVGSTTANLTLTPFDDSIYENSETLTLRIAAGAGYHASEVLSEASAVIDDNDAPAGGYLQFVSSAFSGNEAAGFATVTVKRIGGAAGSVSALVSAQGLTPASQSISWVDGDSTDRIVTFQVVNDHVYTGGKTSAVSLYGVAGGAAAGTPKNAVLTIVDAEPAPPGQIAFAAASYTVGEGVGQFVIPVKRVNGTGGAVTVNVTANGGSATLGTDYSFSPAQITWADGDATDKNVTVQVAQDNIYEGAGENATFLLSIAAGTATLGGQSTTAVTITDDDPAPQIYDVGDAADGYSYNTIASVPWKLLGAGATVRIHYRATPYQEKILLSTRGEAANPIKVCGVPGPNGERPVIHGANATSSSSLGYESWSYTPQLGIVAVARGANTPAGSKPGYIEISGLEISGSTDANYVDIAGATQSYWSSGGAIYLRGAEHVKISNCVFHHCPNGLVAENYSTEPEVNRDLLIQGCYFHDNAKASSWSGDNLQMEAVGVTVQYCRFEANLNRDKTPNIRDRSAGAVYRYNWIEGGSYLMEMIEPSGAINIVTSDPSYAATHIYGNFLVNRNQDGSSLVRFGSSYGTTQYVRPLLHYYQNTVLIDSSSTSRAVFSLTGAGVTVEARNNIVQASASQFQVLSSAGLVNLGKNWMKTGWFGGWNGTVNGSANVISGTNAGFVNLAANDLRLTAASPARNASGPLSVGVPVVTNQYKDVAKSEARYSTDDLGAVAYMSAPSVSTSGATAVTSSSATLGGSVNPNSAPVSVWFEWGTTLTYGQKTAVQSIPAGNQAAAVSASLTGLPAHNAIHFRTVGSNVVQTVFGGDMVFQTANSIPSAQGDSFTLEPNTMLTLPATQLLGNDSDADGDTLAISGVANAVPAGATVLFSNGIVVYQPPANFMGAGSFTYTVTDGFGGSANAAVAITVNTASIPFPQVTGIQVGAGGVITFVFAGTPSSSYAVETSTDLHVWAPLGLVQTGADGVFGIDEQANDSARFYRVKNP
ncbi:MAG TPA: Calx-beta domain-containing protein [Candidatus Limnocylindria bacterium]|nr:Calx-beta domain-containing protein [Candidatus Limnocylindria bacterium]